MSTGDSKEIFLAAKDSLSTLINDKANELFFTLKNFNTHSLDAADTYNDYFIHHHLGHRLFFSIQNSAHILFEAVQLCGKPLTEINAIDYGAGLGTLFMLGGMMGFKRFDYDDHLPEWQATAKAVCKQAGITITDYITGDINAVADFAAKKNIKYDMVLSRNVIEHIYGLPEFYSAIFNHNPKAVVYSTTTANFHNPVMRLYHIYIHKKVERQYYKQQRINEIKKLQPSISPNDLNKLAELTRGKAQQDFIDAVNNFVHNKPIAADKSLRSNVCDCINGVWSEHLLTKDEYRNIIHTTGFKMIYTAGYWDTHYSSGFKNFISRIFNTAIHFLGKKNGTLLSPFVNVAAYN
jgi:2-polyprenyl-3-methyl-5-hydroxy-6-metoxy-1,4-benzoquinol methylase